MTQEPTRCAKHGQTKMKRAEKYPSARCLTQACMFSDNYYCCVFGPFVSLDHWTAIKGCPKNTPPMIPAIAVALSCRDVTLFGISRHVSLISATNRSRRVFSHFKRLNVTRFLRDQGMCGKPVRTSDGPKRSGTSFVVLEIRSSRSSPT